MGWVYGSHVQRLTEAHRLAEDYRRNEGAPMSAERRARSMAYRPARAAVRVPEPREAPRTGVETPETRTAAQIGAERCRESNAGLVCDREQGHDGYHKAPHPRGALFWPTPGQRREWFTDPAGVSDEPTSFLPAPDDEPCPQYSPGGGIPCSVTGPHTAHIFLGTHARDAKDDADEEVE